MENVLAAFIIITIVLFALLSLFQAFVNAQDVLQSSWQEAEILREDRLRTDISAQTAEVKSVGALIEVVIVNDGDTKLTDFDQWDVIVQHYSASDTYSINWMSYVDVEPSQYEWTVVGLYLDDAATIEEVYEPEIFNPGERMLIRTKVWPPMGPNKTSMITISTPNGVTTTTFATR
ncbi:MAG: hypothetical protein WAM60_10465 [Candidatus Promineifilaceae bacterium]